MAQGLFRNGWAELGRKWDRRKLQKQLAEHDRTRAALLGKLGETAWQSGADLSAHSGLRDQLLTLEGRAGEIAAHRKALETQRQGLEERRKGENTKYDAQRAAVEAKKQPVDAELAAARNRQVQQEAAVRSLQDRMRSLVQVMESLQQRVGSLAASPAPDRDEQIAAAKSRIAQIEAEQPEVAAQLRQANEAMQPFTAEVNRHLEQSRQFAAEMERIEQERRGVVQAIDSELNNLRAQLQSTGESAKNVGQDRGTKLVELGRALYESKSADPKLADAMNAVAAEDKRRATTQGALDSSMAQTRALPSGTVPKFLAATLALVLVVLALPIGSYWGWKWWKERAEEEYVEPAPINPYLNHELKAEAAYVLANRLADAKTDKEAQTVLLEVFRTIGLGVYTPDGKKVQGGAERSDKDFFLYDFQLRILARTQMHPSYLEFPDFAYVLGDGLVKLEQPGFLQGILQEAIVRRYREATNSPKDRGNFLILFVDGLARRQPLPYSLEDVGSRSGERYISPVQSILLILEFFMKPGAPRIPDAWLQESWGLIPSVHAQGPCSLIQGDEAQNNFGRGSDIIGQLAAEIPGMVGKVAGAIGDVTGVIGTLGDLLLLYGLDIHLEPQPYTIHLLHDEPFVAAVEATATFDPQGVPDEVLKCGWLAGKKMPVKGPVKDVELTWNFFPALQPHLEMHREMMSFLTGTAGGLRTRTDENGKSTFLIQPHVCVDRRGRIVGQDYMAKVSARIITTDVPTPGFRLGMGFFLKFGPGTIEYLMGGKKAYARFRAEWHKKQPERKQYQR
ncbi:MAG: hypothetical protein ACRD24_01580 [Terriglobales bacterium]